MPLADRRQKGAWAQTAAEHTDSASRWEPSARGMTNSWALPSLQYHSNSGTFARLAASRRHSLAAVHNAVQECRRLRAAPVELNPSSQTIHQCWHAPRRLHHFHSDTLWNRVLPARLAIRFAIADNFGRWLADTAHPCSRRMAAHSDGLACRWAGHRTANADAGVRFGGTDRLGNWVGGTEWMAWLGGGWVRAVTWGTVHFCRFQTERKKAPVSNESRCVWVGSMTCYVDWRFRWASK